MKITLWLYFTSALAVCILMALYLSSLHEIFREAFYGKPLPALSGFVIGARFYLLSLPLVWLVPAVRFSRRSALSTASISLYGVSVLILSIVLFSLALISSALPFIHPASLHAALPALQRTESLAAGSSPYSILGLASRRR